MAGLVLELQADALNSEVNVADLLRKALVVARKLGIDDFAEWVSNELNGYPAGVEIPEYRKVRGEVKVYNPYHGWQPLNFEYPDMADRFATRQSSQSISELVALVKKPNKEGSAYAPFSEEEAQWLMKNMDSPALRPATFISLNQIHGVIDKVRNIVLKWSIELEQKGILGEGMTFSTKEKVAASSVTQITNIIGSMSNSSILQNSPGAIQITQINTPNKEELVEFTDKLDSLINQFELLQLKEFRDDISKLKLRLDTVRLYLSAEQEDPDFIGESLKTIKSVLEGVLSSSIVTAALNPELHQLTSHLLLRLTSWLG